MSECCSDSECRPNVSATLSCPECGEKGHPVATMTLENLLLPDRIPGIGEMPYHFCTTATCNVVYFTGSRETFTKSDLQVRVGIKEDEGPVPVCYCFDYTREEILQEVEETGESAALSFIAQKVKANECSCETENPSGRCCLGEVKKTVRQGKEKVSAGID